MGVDKQDLAESLDFVLDAWNNKEEDGYINFYDEISMKESIEDLKNADAEVLKDILIRRAETIEEDLK